MRIGPCREGMMKLSAPIFRLKYEAKRMARAEGIKLNEAQEQIDALELAIEELTSTTVD